jgi:ubiquinone/menaquinone biosynthesis C-methylase UbiE
MYGDELRSRDYYEGRARWYDWGNRISALLRGASDTRERLKAIDRLNLKPGQRVLEVSVGTGTNLPLMAWYMGPAGQLIGLDISRAMLDMCRRKLRRRTLAFDLVECEAAHLPFAGHVFDAVLHHGGIAEFGDKKGAIEEMMRVARPGAKIVICDPGVPPDRRLPLVSRLLLRLNPPGYAQEPPLHLIPPQARDIHVDWFRGDAWYIIDFVNP